MTNGRLLWVDDEIEHLRAHIIFLRQKGYEVITVSNGTDAIEQCQSQTFNMILLDEMMPGISGLETLQKIREIQLLILAKNFHSYIYEHNLIPFLL